MIEYSNQFKMSFSIGPFEDFIQEENMIRLKMNEQAGNILPAMEMNFKISQPRFLKYINETNPLKVQIGVKDIKIDCQYRILHKVVKEESKGNYNLTLYCLLNNNEYLLTPKSRCFGNALSDGTPVSGFEVLKAVANENFANIDTNITASEDYMVRCQPCISNKQFVDELWQTLCMNDSFALIGITSSGKFKAMDMKSLAKSQPKWTFAYQGGNAKNGISYKEETIDDNSGINNYLFGYIRQQEFWSEDDGSHYVATSGNSTLLSMSPGFNRDNIWLRNTQMAINDNLYNEYWECRATNLSNWGLFSSVNIQLQFDPDWYDVEVLDLCQVFLKSPIGQTEEATSGLAIISGISRIFEKRKITTVVSLNKEGFNQIS